MFWAIPTPLFAVQHSMIQQLKRLRTLDPLPPVLTVPVKL
jgi:hypothetical protein